MRWGARHTRILLGLLLVGTLGGQAWAFELSGVRTQARNKSPEVGATAFMEDALSELANGMGATFPDDQGMLVATPLRGDRDWSLSMKADSQPVPARDRNERRPNLIIGLDLRPSLTPKETGRRVIQTKDEGMVCGLQVLPIAFGASGTEAPDGLVLLAF